MHIKSVAATAAMLMAGTVAADAIATMEPCPAAPGKFSPITVTSQYQAVSTCGAATTKCRGRGRGRGRCQTVFPFNTYSYVSTAIPCAWDGESASSCVVTATDQPVTVSRFMSTITSYAAATATKDGHEFVYSTPVYSTVAKNFVVPYNEIGPNAIPGYGGSGLCKDCDADKDGDSNQGVDVTECRSGLNGPQCVKYRETWISKGSNPSATAPATAAVSTHFVPPSAGVYTFTFPQSAAPTTIWRGGRAWRYGGAPWFAHVTRSFRWGGRPVDVTETVTTTITRNVPQDRVKGTETSQAAFPTGFPGWSRPAHNPAQPTNTASSSDGSNGGWADWDPVNDGGPSYSTTRGGSSESTSRGGWGSDGSSSTTRGSWDPSSTGYPTSSSYTWSSYSSSSSSTPTTTYTYTITTSSSSSTSTTYSTYTTTGSGALPTDDSFYITVEVANAKYHKRSVQYIGFGGDDDAEVVASIAQASLFNFDSQGYLMSGGRFVEIDTSLGFAAFTLTSSRPSQNGGWSVNGDVFSLNAARLGFCASTNSEIFIEYNAQPTFLCITIRLRYLYRRNVSTTTSYTTSTYTTTTSTTTTTTTTTTCDPSAGCGDEYVSTPTSTIQFAARHKRHYGRVY